MHTYHKWGELTGLCALLFISNELFQNDFVQFILLQPMQFGIQGRCYTHVETRHGGCERWERMMPQDILGCICLGEGAG